MKDEILTINDRREEKFLRKRTVDFDFKKFARKEITELIAKMKKIMGAAYGIGLSSNQIGLNYKIFIAQVPTQEGGQKFYAIFNPKIEKIGSEKNIFEEGCLSIPGLYGEVPRADKITISGLDKNGKHLKIKAWGLLARVFQHEIDHLEGKLLTDRTKKLYKAPTTYRLKKREEDTKSR